MALNPERTMLPADYLAFERAQTAAKHEYLDGQITAMGDACVAHNLIAVNVLTTLRLQMRGRPCTVFGGDMRVKVSATGHYTSFLRKRASFPTWLGQSRHAKVGNAKRSCLCS